MKNKEGVTPLFLQKRSKSSRFSSWSGEANHFKDKLFRSFYIFLLFAIDFVMFIYSINGRLFEDGVFNRAVAVILETALAVSVLLIFCLSFSKLAQNIVCALMTVMVTVIFFNQFALFDTGNFLEKWFAQHASWLSFLCFMPSSWIVSLLLGILIFFVFRYSDAILFVTMVLLLSGIIGIQKNERILPTDTEYMEVKSFDGVKLAETSSSNIIYLMVPKLPSYQFLNSVDNPMFRDLRDLLIGFYAVNQFEMYPNAFVQNPDTMNNLIDIFNQVDYSSSTSANRGYAEYLNKWDFVHGGLEILSLEDNLLYDYLKRNGYGISMYPMPQFDFCLKSGEFNTNRCVVKGYKTVELYDDHSSVEKNIYALLGEWMLSIKMRELNSFAKMLLNMSPLKGYKVLAENRRVSLEGADKLFDRLSSDFISDGGDQAYLAYVDLPSDIYIYDEYCNIKPRKNWVALKNNSLYAGNAEEKRSAYIEQAKCLVGRMQEFMDEILKQKKIANTNIFIQGVSTVRELAPKTSDKYGQFVTDKLVNLAIRKGDKPKFIVNANICLASDFTKSSIRYQDYCYTLDDMKMPKNDIVNYKKNMINNSVIRSNKLSTIVANYRDWYELYKANNVAYQKKLAQQRQEVLARKNRQENVEQYGRTQSGSQDRQSSGVSESNIFELTDDLAEVPSEIDAPVVPENENQDKKPEKTTVIDDGASVLPEAPQADSQVIKEVSPENAVPPAGDADTESVGIPDIALDSLPVESEVKSVEPPADEKAVKEADEVISKTSSDKESVDQGISDTKNPEDELDLF